MSDSMGTVRLIVKQAGSVVTVPLGELPQARSWLTGGANEPITAEQLLTVVDPASLALVAQEAGVEPAAFAEAVAGALPDVVDQASPDGQVDPQLNVRIVGGDEIEPHSHPHQISLR